MRYQDLIRPKSIKKSSLEKSIPRDYNSLLEQKLKEKTGKLLDKKTPTVTELAEKYKTSLLAVEQQLKKGIKVEMEHTNKTSVAREIALDHLGEDLYYYVKLAKVEKGVDECADDPDCDCCDDEITENPREVYMLKLHNENFADGKGPGRPGDSQRHGIPKKASMSTLKKAAHAKGRKGQLARWQINMRNGRKKHSKE